MYIHSTYTNLLNFMFSFVYLAHVSQASKKKHEITWWIFLMESDVDSSSAAVSRRSRSPRKWSSEPANRCGAEVPLRAGAVPKRTAIAIRFTGITWSLLLVTYDLWSIWFLIFFLGCPMTWPTDAYISYVFIRQMRPHYWFPIQLCIQQLLNSQFPYTVFDVEPLQKCKDEPITLILEAAFIFPVAADCGAHAGHCGCHNLCFAHCWSLKISQDIARNLKDAGFRNFLDTTATSPRRVARWRLWCWCRWLCSWVKKLELRE